LLPAHPNLLDILKDYIRKLALSAANLGGQVNYSNSFPLYDGMPMAFPIHESLFIRLLIDNKGLVRGTVPNSSR